MLNCNVNSQKYEKDTAIALLEKKREVVLEMQELFDWLAGALPSAELLPAPSTFNTARHPLNIRFLSGERRDSTTSGAHRRQHAAQAVEMGYLSISLATVYYITYPIIYLLSIILFALLVIIAPAVHLVHYILYACWYPIHILGKFEV